MTPHERANYYLPYFEIAEKSVVVLSIVIPFVFLVIGGCFQIINLLELDITFVRFFSITQLIADSLIFLILFIYKILLPTSIGIVFVWSISLDKFNKVIQNKINDPQKTEFILAFIGSIILGSIYFLFRKIYGSPYSSEIQNMVPFIHFIFGFILYILFKKKSKIRETDPKNKSRKIISFTFLIYFIFSTFFLTYSKYYFSFLPNNSFYNYEKILKKYNDKGFESKILYFNDNYVFIELKKDTIMMISRPQPYVKIAVLKSEALFQEDK